MKITTIQKIKPPDDLTIHILPTDSINTVKIKILNIFIEKNQICNIKKID